MNLPDFITFTGVDADTDFGAMARLSALYPIEWGILFSGKRQGQEPRYPALTVVGRLLNEFPTLMLSAHLCGADAREVIEQGQSKYDSMIRGHFLRVQINTADPMVQPSLIADWANRQHVRAILQTRTSFPYVGRVDVLYDASGGRGKLPEPDAWPYAVDTTFCGYAGGLGPDTVKAALAVIAGRAQRYWIDMESGVRDDADRFSVEKCRAVCEAVYGVRP